MLKVLNKKYLALPLFIMICFITIFAFTTVGNAKENTEYGYSSVEIMDGDTIESIALEYLSCTDYSFQDMMYEIRRINHLSTDIIYSGSYLVVPLLCYN